MSDVEIKENNIKVKIEDEMRGAYLDYAMSVIVGRALPDVRDGLKPVHRRALYAMYDLGNTHNKPYKKSARVVGDVIGKYHPHGDTAVYDTIVRLAQPFSLRYPLVDGQGNFGSIDGDSAAAMRYTEVRMNKITSELLADIEKETVDFRPNYDDTLMEPRVFPAKYPNLLVNGSSGIAVGMATNIPPHNLGEIIDATIILIDEPTSTTDDLLKVVKGPDFPTGAGMFSSGIKEALRKGRGSVTVRAKAEIEEWKNDRQRIVVTEIPYQVNKAKLIERIANLVRDKKITGISDLRDESDRVGMRIVIELKKGENSLVILNRLYKLTQLQDNFSIIMLGIHQNRPKLFNLRDMLWAFVEHRRDVVIRRTRFELRKAEARAHILEGLKIAVENIDEVVTLIKKSKNAVEAKAALSVKFDLSEIQAQAVLDLKLQRLTGLERDKIVEEYKQVMLLIEELKRILASEKLIYEIIKDELTEIKEKYGDERRTEILVDSNSDFEVEDLVANEKTLVTITHKGYIRRMDPKHFRAQGRGGRGVKGTSSNSGTDEDFVTSLYRTNTLDYLLCFTDKGKVYRMKVYSIPETGRVSKGKSIANLLSLGQGEQIKAVLPVENFDTKDTFIFMTTRNGIVKKTALKDFSNIKSSGIVAIQCKPGEELISAKLTDGTADIFLCTKQGKSIRFGEGNVRSMGRAARGVTGMKLDEGDQVVGMEVLNTDGEFEILCVTDGGYGKRTDVADYRQQTRGGKGILAMRVEAGKNGQVMGVCQVLKKDELMIVSTQGKLIRLRVGEISEQGRVTMGVRLIRLSPGEKVATIEYLAENRETEESDDSNGSNGSNLDH